MIKPHPKTFLHKGTKKVVVDGVSMEIPFNVPVRHLSDIPLRPIHRGRVSKALGLKPKQKRVIV
jgi:hypothetical protein